MEAGFPGLIFTTCWNKPFEYHVSSDSWMMIMDSNSHPACCNTAQTQQEMRPDTEGLVPQQ
jgi:hypothetical protein